MKQFDMQLFFVFFGCCCCCYFLVKGTLHQKICTYLYLLVPKLHDFLSLVEHKSIREMSQYFFVHTIQTILVLPGGLGTGVGYGGKVLKTFIRCEILITKI